MAWRVYLTGLALLLLAGAFLLTDRLLYPPGITEANVKRIRPGMTLAQVERLLRGRAAQEEPLCVVLLFSVPPRNSRSPVTDEPFCWLRLGHGLAGSVPVYFTPQGKVMRADFVPTPGPSLGVQAVESQP